MIYSLVNTKRSGTAHVPLPASQSFAMASLMVLIDCISRGWDATPEDWYYYTTFSRVDRNRLIQSCLTF